MTWDCSSFKKPTAEELRQLLTDEQFQVTQAEGTERPFGNPYWNHHEAGIYVDVVSGEPLFCSQDKFDSGTGWPSFTRPISKDCVVTKADHSLFRVRTEVRSRMPTPIWDTYSMMDLSRPDSGFALIQPRFVSSRETD